MDQKNGRKINLNQVVSTILMFAVMFGIMYFLLIRPQKKQQDKVQSMLDSLQVGDSIVTIGGLHGIIDEINDETGTVVLDCEGIYLTFERRAISRVTLKGTDTGNDTQAEELGTNEPNAEEDISEE